MMNAYVTKRVSPTGYVAVTRHLAEFMFQRGSEIVLCGSKVNNFNVLKNQQMGLRVSRLSHPNTPFPLLVYEYMHAMPRDIIGRHCVFYAESEAATEAYGTIKGLETPSYKTLKPLNISRTRKSRVVKT